VRFDACGGSPRRFRTAWRVASRPIAEHRCAVPPLALAALALVASAPLQVETAPARARPGDAVLVTVRGVESAPGASVAGRELAFFRVAGGWGAVAGLPLETPPGPLAVSAAVTRPDGWSVEGSARLEVVAPAFPHRELEVDRQFVEPPPPEIARRIEADRAAFVKAFSQPGSAPLFTRGFALPRRARITAHFGEERRLNASKSSQHYGADLKGKVGAPVASSNDGEVVLVRDCWASGLSVVVWHGAGIYTTYFHLSASSVREGQRVRRGERLGLVGRSGRVSGPHLHWGVRVHDLYVDPESVLRLRLAPLPR
jgi:murein DD-endopeptidase MepM/ murein hydrolase activator NlpD